MDTWRARLGLGVLLLTACSSSSGIETLDDEDLEAKIKKILNDAEIPVTTVECPAGREAQKGSTFECTAEDAGGRPVEVAVTQTDDDGNLLVETKTIYAPIVEREIDGGNASEASCPDGVPLVDGSGEIECTATVGGRGVTLVVTVEGGRVTRIVEKEGTEPGDPPEPACADVWSGGADPACDACAAANCCDELVACASGTPCAEYALCTRSCAPGDESCIQSSCGHLGEGRAASEAVLECMTACPASC